jgi:hypothetical protein
VFPRSIRFVGGSGIIRELSKVPLVGPPIDSAVTLAVRLSNYIWTRQTYPIKWKHFSNSASHRLFVQQRPVLNEQQRAVVNDLSRDGVAFIPFQALIGAKALWVQLNEIVDDFRTSNVVQDRIKTYPAEFSSREMSGDDYLIKLLPKHPTFELNHPLLQLFLNPSLLNVVNSYQELWAKLIYVDIWHTIPGDMGRRIGSQNWHRDPEDMKMVKVYVYFSDVDLAAGPLEYVRGSNRQGQYGNLWKWHALDGPHRYKTEEELQREVPFEQFVNCVGPSGTVIFCDTSGLHRGGIATSGARVLATCTFVTPASLSSLSQRRFTVANPTSTVLSEGASFALA